MTSGIRNGWEAVCCHPVLAGLVPGCVGLLLVLLTLDASGSYPGLLPGPGITIDESFNVQQGVLLVEALRAYGLFLFDPLNAKEIFGGEGGLPYLPDHPPLGRWVLGLFHHLAWTVAPPLDPVGPAVTVCARVGTAVMFGLTMVLSGATAAYWFGRSAGWIAAFSVLLMPRVFGHAHLAALESTVNLTYGLAVLCLAHRFRLQPTVWMPTAGRQQETATGKEAPPWRFGGLLRQVGFPGVMLGLALLTKIQGFLVLPCALMWGLFY